MKLLLHMCCGPCSVYPVSVLQVENIKLEGLFFNPNIHPYDEFMRRKENVRIFSKIKNMPVTYMDDFKQEVWENWDRKHKAGSLELMLENSTFSTGSATESKPNEGINTSAVPANGYDAEPRCNMCYRVRLDQTASVAKEKGFDAFTTTLLVSPYQKHELICELGRQAAQKYGIDFYYSDFRPGFRQGQLGAKEMGLYRQKYCGCIISKG